MFADTKKLLEKAQRGRYAVGHFNINNMEMVQGIVQAAEKMRSPIILAASEGAIRYAGMEYLFQLAKTASDLSHIPIALHLDHGKDLKLIKKAISSGYSSVMIDASQENFDKNVALTKKVVSWAHHKNVSVEAELGTIGGAEDKIRSRKIIYTDPERAKTFVEQTGCDFLAVAIGTSHGAYKFAGKSSLHQDILQKIKNKVKVPLVLHGASGVPAQIVKEARKYGARLPGVYGVPDPQIKKAIKNGICKINTDTDLRLAFDAAVRKMVKTKAEDFDPRHLLGPARDEVQKVVEQRIRLFGSAKKA